MVTRADDPVDAGGTGSDAPGGTGATGMSGPGDEAALAEVGLLPGEAVRWQRKAGGRWHQGVVIRREPDGSIAVHDEDGAWRSLPVDRLETRGRTRRGTTRWQPVVARAAGPHQLGMWD